MEAALERIGRDAGVSAFWQELKRGSEKQCESVDARNAARERGGAVPDSWISWQEASDYYLKQGPSVICVTYNRGMLSYGEVWGWQSASLLG